MELIKHQSLNIIGVDRRRFDLGCPKRFIKELIFYIFYDFKLISSKIPGLCENFAVEDHGYLNFKQIFDCNLCLIFN